MAETLLEKLERMGKLEILDPSGLGIDKQSVANYLQKTEALTNPELYQELKPDNRYMVLLLSQINFPNHTEGEFVLLEKDNIDQPLPTCLPGFLLPNSKEDFNPESELERTVQYIDKRIIPTLPTNPDEIMVFDERIEVNQYHDVQIIGDPKKVQENGKEVFKFTADVTVNLTRKEADLPYHSVQEYWEGAVKPIITNPNISRAQKNLELWNCYRNLMTAVNSTFAIKDSQYKTEVKKFANAIHNLTRVLSNAQSIPSQYNTQPEENQWKEVSINETFISKEDDVKIKGPDQRLFLDSDVLTKMAKHQARDYFHQPLEIQLYDLDVELKKD